MINPIKDLDYCSICYSEETQLLPVPCNNIHPDTVDMNCLFAWLKRENPICHLCRTPLVKARVITYLFLSSDTPEEFTEQKNAFLCTLPKTSHAFIETKSLTREFCELIFINYVVSNPSLYHTFREYYNTLTTPIPIDPPSDLEEIGYQLRREPILPNKRVLECLFIGIVVILLLGVLHTLTK